MITEDEFYDAVDATLDKLEKEEEKVSNKHFIHLKIEMKYPWYICSFTQNHAYLSWFMALLGYSPQTLGVGPTYPCVNLGHEY